MKLLEQQKKKKKYQISMIENLKGNKKNKLLINKLQRGTIKNQNIFKLLMDISKHVHLEK